MMGNAKRGILTLLFVSSLYAEDPLLQALEDENDPTIALKEGDFGLQNKDYGSVGGVVKPVNQVTLTFIKPDIVTKLPLEGDFFAQGAVIAAQDDRQVQIDLREAQYQLEVSKLAVETAQHEMKKKERLLEQNVVAPIAVTEAEFELRKANAQLRIAEAGVATAELKHKETMLYAPFDGVVSRVHLRTGEQSSMNQPVVDLMNVEKLELQVDVPWHLADGLQVGSKTAIMVGTEEVGKASVKTIMPFYDPTTGLRRIVWTIEPVSSQMLAGRYVTLQPWYTQ